jgi:hypothetical protein
MPKILYVCENCYDNNPEGCGYTDSSELRLMPDGRQICCHCFDDEPPVYPAGVDLEQDPEPIRWPDLPRIQAVAAA